MKRIEIHVREITKEGTEKAFETSKHPSGSGIIISSNVTTTTETSPTRFTTTTTKFENWHRNESSSLAQILDKSVRPVVSEALEASGCACFVFFGQNRSENDEIIRVVEDVFFSRSRAISAGSADVPNCGVAVFRGFSEFSVRPHLTEIGGENETFSIIDTRNKNINQGRFDV